VGVAIILIGLRGVDNRSGLRVSWNLGFYQFVRHRHPRWGGMQVGFGDLTLWSFLMASAHGAGLMVLPILFGISSGESPSGSVASMYHTHVSSVGEATTNLPAILVHILEYLVVTGLSLG